MSSGLKIDFEKFDGKGNFSMWRTRVEDLLVQQELDLALEEKPEGMTDQAWSSLEKRACALIRWCLADSVLYGVLEEKTPKGLWSRLHTLYMGRNMCNKLMLKKQLYSLRMQEGGDMLEHIQRFDRLSTDLLNLGVKMEEEDKSLMLLCSLHESFDPLVTTLLYGKETLIYEEIVSVLRTNEQREQMVRATVSLPQDAMVAGERSWRGKERRETGEREDFSRGIREVRCYLCRKLGHIKRDCPRRKKGKGEGLRSESSSAVAEGDESDDLLMLSAGHMEETDRWILDSASSYHCTPHREWFSSYTQIGEGQQVILGDGSSCGVAGVGSIRLRMFDGRVRTLTDVHHVPGLRRSVVSLGHLEEKGFIFRSSSGILNVSKGNKVVIRGRRLRSRLYQMEGSVVSRETDVIASVMEDQPEVQSVQIGQLMVCLSELPKEVSPDHREVEHRVQMCPHVEEEEHLGEVPPRVMKKSMIMVQTLGEEVQRELVSPRCSSSSERAPGDGLEVYASGIDATAVTETQRPMRSYFTSADHRWVGGRGVWLQLLQYFPMLRQEMLQEQRWFGPLGQ